MRKHKGYEYRRITKKKVNTSKIKEMLADIIWLTGIIIVISVGVSHIMIESRISELELKQGNMLENIITIQEYEQLTNDMKIINDGLDDLLERIE